ncbi:ATP-binding cassette domain-containing protein [Marinifilum sp. D737]|uniref:ATP-binding cassette domain-containing protein n=1 Tax=Marinifilum sp. D737 TaxID=2969628 RepID=UPI002272ED4C|nr:ATP-binding cassette domain-containing protein [Marinifilum sp. D737]MCY1635961.1 ATP-binding cassette domain-containing protein [Marinifilum sp. D737]
MIDIKNLTVRYGSNLIFNNSSAYFQKGMCYGILGLNGSGKTTLFNVLYKFKNYQGTITINKKKVKRSNIAYLPSENYYYYNLTGREYLSIFSKKSNQKKVNEFQALFNLPLDKFIKEYSSGMKKKLALVGILLLNRNIFLLDEPFENLDVDSLYIFQEIIKILKSKGRTIIISSHNINVLEGVCDTYYFIENQGINELADCKKIYIRDTLKNKYDDLMKEIIL